MMHDSIAIFPCNYDTLVLNHNKARFNLKAVKKKTPDNLVSQCAQVICKQTHLPYLEEVILSVPCHLAVTLLAEAINNEFMYPTAIRTFIANWPLTELCLAKIVENDLGFLEYETYLDTVVHQGVIIRTKKCKLQCLDLRGYTIKDTLGKLAVLMWPLMSLPHSKRRNLKHLTKIVLEQAGLRREDRLASDIIPRLIREALQNSLVRSKHIKFSKGQKLVVKIDELVFSTQNSFFMDYLIRHCLRTITPITIQVSNIAIMSELNIGDEILDSVAPFIVFRGHDRETLSGIWLQNLEDNVFFIIQDDLHPFVHLTGLGISNCNISLQEGRTRRRTSARARVRELLGCFPKLVRLDLSQNSLSGCLSEILDSLESPLVYLGLRECDLLDRDFDYLARSKHSKSLRHLNLARICGLFFGDEFAVHSTTLVKKLKHFPNLALVNIQQNQLTDSSVNEICDTIANHWTKLKALNIRDNIFTPDNALKILKACAKVPTMQLVRLSYSHNLMEAMGMFENARQEFIQAVRDTMREADREDIEVDVHRLAYANEMAILAN